MEKMNLSKFYFKCRRGILELDIILFNFLKNISYMCEEKQKNFLFLLDESDINLYGWLVKKDPCPNKFLNLVKEINDITEVTLLKSL